MYEPREGTRIERIEQAVDDYYQAGDLEALYYVRETIRQDDSKRLWSLLTKANAHVAYSEAEMWAHRAMDATDGKVRAEAIEKARAIAARMDKVPAPVLAMNKWLKEISR